MTDLAVRGNIHSNAIFTRPIFRAPRADALNSGTNLETPMPPVNVGERLWIERLKNVNGAVRAHEQAHLAAIATYAQGPVQYSYIIGPDGTHYAVGGSIDVNLSPVPGDPEATIRKAQALIRSAYSPSMPSSADMRVAATAYRMEMDAKRALAREEQKSDEGMTPAVGLSGTDPAGLETSQLETASPTLRDVFPVPGNPNATLEKARDIIRNAALSPEISTQEMQVTARAYRMAAQATLEIARERLMDEQGKRVNIYG